MKSPFLSSPAEIPSLFLKFMPRSVSVLDKSLFFSGLNSSPKVLATLRLFRAKECEISGGNSLKIRVAKALLVLTRYKNLSLIRPKSGFHTIIKRKNGLEHRIYQNFFRLIAQPLYGFTVGNHTFENSTAFYVLLFMFLYQGFPILGLFLLDRAIITLWKSPLVWDLECEMQQ